ncbi:endolytic transglycosylase MltG [Candidatus Parcubacteria bacterium]|nr:endolytic transglycosylase MltG [Candidatus Parcubacteria bacterium]
MKKLIIFRAKQGKQGSMKQVLIFLILFLIAIFFIWQGIYTSKDSTSLEEKVFSVERGQGLFQIGENLEKQDLIKSRFLFNFYVISKKKQGNLQAGQYLLSSSMNIPQVAQKMILGDVYKIKITIPEGFTLKQIEERITSNLTRTFLINIEINEFKDEYDFLKDMPDSALLEGFLFPDTYYFFPEAETEEIVKVFLDNFDRKLTSELRAEIEKQGKTVFEIITMASMIEKEVITLKDKKMVSGILWKRLENKMPFQVDATIAYLTGKKTTKVSTEDLKIDSPYNTYKYLGLPIGPICNPGLDSILAAVYPEDSNYWYYLSTSEKETIFSKTLKEHRINKAKYLQ